MSTMLNQTDTCAFPDRPKDGGLSLQAILSSGDAGKYLRHDLESEKSLLHIRFVVNPWQIIGGRLVLLAGLDQQGEEVLRIVYDSSSGTITTSTPGIVHASAILDGVISWQCIEVALDSSGGALYLWVNGVLADQSGADLSGVGIKAILFGAINKQTDVTGELFLDELIFSDEYIGPVTVQPAQKHAGDPARWLVVYNLAVADAALWVEAYRQLHDIPFANLLGLVLPVTEIIDAAEYVSMVNQIDDYLTDNHLMNQIMGILIGYRAPGYVDFTGQGPIEAIPALIHTNNLTAGMLTNPNASPAELQRLSFNDLSGVRMTARFDAHDLQQAYNVLDSATTTNNSGLNSAESTIYFDPFVGDEPTYQQAFTDMLDWTTGMGSMQTRLPIVLSGDPASNEEASFADVSGDGVYWGWDSSLPDPNIFVDPPGQRAVCVQLYLGASATTLRSETPGNWIDTPIHAGYAAAIASCRDNPITAIPDVDAFFGALTDGWTLAEAWHVSQPLLRSGFYLVGDPLMQAMMPKQGIEVFGPLASLEEMDVTLPSYVLPANSTSINLGNDLPAANSTRHYVIRRSDSEGRIETSSRSICVERVDDALHQAITMPAWPDVEAWPLCVENGEVRLSAIWCGRLGDSGIQRIELLHQETGQAVAVADTPDFDVHSHAIEVLLPLPATKTRYRWRFASHGGVEYYTPFSDWFDPAGTPAAYLQVQGAST